MLQKRLAYTEWSHLLRGLHVKQKLAMLNASGNTRLAWCKYPAAKVAIMLFKQADLTFSCVHTCKAHPTRQAHKAIRIGPKHLALQGATVARGLYVVLSRAARYCTATGSVEA